MNVTNFNTIPSLFFPKVEPVEEVAKNKISSVSKIESLSQINVNQPDKTVFFFDLDDTTFDFPHMLGSKGWRRYISEATKKLDTTKNWHDFFSFLLAQKHPLAAVEPMTSEFVKNLQEKGYIACGLTSRERKQWYNTQQEGVDEVTNKQLSSININFNNNSLENAYPYLALDKEYFNGTFFANTDLKGEYLLNLLKTAPELPQKVIFIDDKNNQVESVAKALTELGIENECYFYTATDAKAKTFNPLIANIQLYYFLKSDCQVVLTDGQAALIAKENPKNDVNYYLENILQLAKNKL